MTSPLTANFDNPGDFEGWSCGKITTCGKFGNICGGYDVKTGGDDIKKTFMLPAGDTYWVTMDFIKIDSWFAWRSTCSRTEVYLVVPSWCLTTVDIIIRLKMAAYSPTGTARQLMCL